jgi:hypothetical protein
MCARVRWAATSRTVHAAHSEGVGHSCSDRSSRRFATSDRWSSMIRHTSSLSMSPSRKFVPPTRIAFRETLRWFGSPMTQARPEYSLEGDESATVVRHVAVGELYGWMRFMKPAAAWMANRERSRTLNSLKRSLESD